MKNKLIKLLALPVIALSWFGQSAEAGQKSLVKEIVMEEPAKWWDASVSTGYDSLYMFRGINVLRQDKSYGTGLYWFDVNGTWNITENDSLNVGYWMAFGLSKTPYTEINAYTTYTRTIGNLSLDLGYTFYYVVQDPLYSHELMAGASYAIELPFMTLTPGIYYYFNLGPDSVDGKGIARTASSYLDLRLDGSIPVYKEAVSLDPWISLGNNFRYNANTDGNLFSGLNNLEIGVSLPIQLTSVISVSPYAAFSQAVNNGGLLGTRDSTFWGGASVSLSF